MRFYLLLGWLKFKVWVKETWDQMNKDLDERGSPLPSLSESEFLMMDGYKECLKDIQSYIISHPHERVKGDLSQIVMILATKKGINLS